MRQCQSCGETYTESANFCDLDGQPLVSTIEMSGTRPAAPASAPTMGQFWLTGLIGAIAGIVVCLAIYAVFTLSQLQATQQPEQKPTRTATVQEEPRRVTSAPAQPTEPAAVESPSTEEEPTAEASPVAVSESAPEVVEAHLNRGPISTGQKLNSEEKTAVHTVIVMNDGSSVEVDAAWQDSQGVWYRRGGVVSFIDRQRVKAITARAEPKKGPTDSQ